MPMLGSSTLDRVAITVLAIPPPPHDLAA